MVNVDELEVLKIRQDELNGMLLDEFLKANFGESSASDWENEDSSDEVYVIKEV